ncbi:alpha/beta hydrolase [Streptosporangiaceae bacterium NEAU-GS5]|nr:alpha/beta hydrolase [Streptosporangiaceae bacterium NEAU-GS5]
MSTLSVPGATLYYETHGSGPVLLIIPGGPTDAGIFTALAAQLSDSYTVVPYDPRGNSRSVPDDPTLDQDMDVHGDDAAALITALGDRPAYVLGSSGGAQIGLNLAARHPDKVRVLVAHEPPCVPLLPEPEAAEGLAGMADVVADYEKQGVEAGMKRFEQVIGMEGQQQEPPKTPPTPEEMATWGRIGGNVEFFLAHGVKPISGYVPDVAALRDGATSVVVGIGADTPNHQIAYRSAKSLAGRLGSAPVVFPGDHGGFASHPAEFAETLRKVFA